jgi:flagellar biosynthesis protein FlhG
MINTVLDQASGLRRMNQKKNHGVKVIAVTGGKGGVGKPTSL